MQPALTVRGYGPLVGRPILKPLAVGPERRRKILAETARPDPEGGCHRDVGEGESPTDKEFAVGEFVAKSLHRGLETELDADNGPIAFLIFGRRAVTDG